MIQKCPEKELEMRLCYDGLVCAKEAGLNSETVKEYIRRWHRSITDYFVECYKNVLFVR